MLKSIKGKRFKSIYHGIAFISIITIAFLILFYSIKSGAVSYALGNLIMSIAEALRMINRFITKMLWELGFWLRFYV